MIKQHSDFSKHGNSRSRKQPSWLLRQAKRFPVALLLLVLGCNQNKSIDVSSIDHKDKSGAYREAVQTDVLGKFSGKGEIITDRSSLIGTWRWSPKSARSGVEMPEFTYEMFADRKCRITGGGQDSEKTNGISTTMAQLRFSTGLTQSPTFIQKEATRRCDRTSAL